MNQNLAFGLVIVLALAGCGGGGSSSSGTETPTEVEQPSSVSSVSIPTYGYQHGPIEVGFDHYRISQYWGDTKLCYVGRDKRLGISFKAEDDSAVYLKHGQWDCTDKAENSTGLTVKVLSSKMTTATWSKGRPESLDGQLLPHQPEVLEITGTVVEAGNGFSEGDSFYNIYWIDGSSAKNERTHRLYFGTAAREKDSSVTPELNTDQYYTTLSVDAQSYGISIDKAHQEITRDFFNPDGALFRNEAVVRYTTEDEAGIYLCGERNGTNRFGAYVGYKSYYAWQSSLSGAIFTASEGDAMYSPSMEKYCEQWLKEHY